MLRTIRRISQGFFLLLFIFLIVTATYPLRILLPPEIFLRFDPLIAFTASIASRALLPLLVLAGISVLLTVLVGRAFCGWVCPFGTTLDILDWLFLRRRVRSKAPAGRLRKVKYLLLAAVLVLAVLGVQAAGWFDPLSMATRTYGTVLFPIADRMLEGSLDVLARLPGLGTVFGPAYDFFHDMEVRYVFRGNVFRLSFLFLFVLGLIFALQLYQKRFWCRALCPLGALLGLVSRWRLLGLQVTEACTDCGLCEKVCPVGAIEGHKVSPQECIQCYNCVAVCRAEAIRARLGAPAKKEEVFPVLPGRRQFVKSAVVGVLLAPLFKLNLVRRRDRGRVLRPPGALAEDEFLARCVRCGECMKVCPNNALHPALLEAGAEALWTPRVIPRVGYCQVPCAPLSDEHTNLCGRVCPTGAIRKLTYQERLATRMGTAYFDRSKCIPYVEHTNCGKCEEHCPTKVIQFRRTEVQLGPPVKEGVPRGEAKPREVDLPYVEQALCIGCGQCENVCPLEGQAGIRVGPLQVE